MNRAQKLVVGFFTVVIIAITLLSVAYYQVKSTGEIITEIPADQIIFYYGETCPHCKIVEEFMKNNSIETKINITQKEVYKNQVNANELIKVGDFCKLTKDYIGAVPLLYSDGKCYVGDKDIINFLTKKLNISVSA